MLPSPAPQTRGFLFADLRGYSAFVEAHGDLAARDLLHRYRALVRAEIDAFHGAEVRTEGDSFYIVFASVSEAVQAGLAIRDAATIAGAEPGAPPIRVGIGIHAGEVTDGEDGIVSSAVNIAARVCAVAGPGEVLVTDTVRSLVRTALSLRFDPHGTHRLKGIAESTRLYRVASGAAPPQVANGRRRPVVALGVAGIALAAVVGAVVLGQPAASPESTPGASLLPIGSVPVSPASSDDASGPSPSGSAPYPDAAEAALLDRLPSDVADACKRADPEDRPVYERSLSNAGQAASFIEIPLGIEAGLTCLTDFNRVVYWRAFGTGNVDAAFARQVSRFGAQPGSCAEGDRASERWEAGAHEGNLLCYISATGHAVLEWTFDDEGVYVVASRRDGDAGALYAWWRGVGRLMSR